MGLKKIAKSLSGEAAIKKGLDKSAAIQMQQWREGKVGAEAFQKELAPYEEVGLEGLAGYDELMDDPSKVKDTPGYEFGLSEGRRVIEQGAAAKGGLFSGKTMRRLMEYGSDYFSKQYDAALAREKTRIDIGLGAKSMKGTVATSIMGQAVTVGANVGNTIQYGYTSKGNRQWAQTQKALEWVPGGGGMGGMGGMM